MSDPTPYVPGYSFSQYQATNPSRPLPADKVDNELQMIGVASLAAANAIEDVRRSDGALQNAIVTKQSLASDVLIGLGAPVLWQANTDYFAGSSTVFSNSKFYIALLDHNSGPTFDPTKWSLLADLSGAAVADSGLWFTALESPKTANYGVVAADAGRTIVGNSTSALTFTFDTAAGLGTGLYIIKNANTGVVTVVAASGQSIEGVANPSGIALAKGWALFAWASGSVVRAIVVADYATRMKGPASAVSGNFAVFGDTSGTLLADSNLSTSAIGSFVFLTETIKTADYTVVLNDAGTLLVANKATAIQFTLPAASTSTGRVYAARNIGTGDLTVSRSGSDTIEGGTIFVIKQSSAAYFICNGISWKVLNFPRFATSAEVMAGTATGLPIDPAGANSIQFVQPGYLKGLTLSSPTTTTISVAAGFCANEDASTLRPMTLASAMPKALTAWVPGSGNGALDAGTIAASTWYHVHLIIPTGGGAPDVLLSLSLTSPTMPAGYTGRRRVGSVLTNGSSQITPFTQVGDRFYWSSSVQNAGSAITDTVAHLAPLSVPPGLNIEAEFSVMNTASAFVITYVSSPLQNDEVPVDSSTAAPGYTTVAGSGAGARISGGRLRLTTDTNQCIRFRNGTATSTTVGITMYSYLDGRGRL